jgi:hypothetical protein
MTIKRMAVLAALGFVGVWFPGADNAKAGNQASPEWSSGPIDLSAQATPRPRRVPRIEVFPRRQYYYPGPDAVRECRAWLAQELRPSGPVVVPRMRCWWERRY